MSLAEASKNASSELKEFQSWKVKVQGGVGSARWDTKDKRARVQAFYVHIGVHGMEGGTPLRVGWVQPPRDSVLKKNDIKTKRSPVATDTYMYR